MGCSNARLLVQAPSATETGARTNKPLSPSTEGTSPANVAIDTTTRMHLTGVDLVVERNGSYTLLLTPKTHKQLMPYVLRKKRFRILVDKPRADQALASNESGMEDNPELKSTSEKDKQSKDHQMNQTIIESIEKVASDELNKASSRLLCGRSIDRGNPGDDEENIQSDDEGMIEEIVTTVEQDKDLECKFKKKIQTKKTMSQDPDTHSTITKVVKTEVTEITRTITINDHHDLERAKRELGIDDVNRLLPSSSWGNQSTSVETKEKHHETKQETILSKDLSWDSQTKPADLEKRQILAGSTTVGRGPVIETISTQTPKLEHVSSETKKKKKKKSKLCSCTRSTDEEPDKKNLTVDSCAEKKTVAIVTSQITKSVIDTQVEGRCLISDDIKQLITDKKFLLIEYIHSKIFAPSNLFASDEQDLKGRKVSSRILDLLRYDRCTSWTQMFEQLTEEYNNYLPSNLIIQPMINTYETLFTHKQSNLLNTFVTIHNENDIKNIQENNDYISIIQKHMCQQDNQPHIDVIVQQTVDHLQDTLDHLQATTPEEQIEKVVNYDEQPLKEVNMADDLQQPLPVYNEEQLVKMLANASQHKPITLAEAIAYQYLDIEDPKLGLSNDAIQHIKHLFRPLSDQSIANLIRIQRSGEYLTDIDLAETNPFEKLNTTEPYIYQLQQSFEPTLDFNEKQFRSLTEAILNNKEQYDQLEFFVARSSLPIYDMKESSTNDFSQSDSGYSMTTTTHDSLASKIKIEFEPIINQDIPVPPVRDDIHEHEKIDLDKATQEKLHEYELDHDLIQIIKSNFGGSDKTIGQAILSRELRLDSTDPNDVARLHSMGIYKEQARILSAFFFPKQTRIIAYSPEPGRFVEAQTRYNPDFPGYKTDTTIIQIQEKQLSSDHLPKQRNIHDNRTTTGISEDIKQSETIVPLTSTLSLSSTEAAPTTESEEKQSPSPLPSSLSAPAKKRKSSGSGSLLSCFKSKKPKPGTEQQGQATIQPTTAMSETTAPQQSAKSSGEQLLQEKSIINYGIGPDGKRIYIDSFRERDGLDMSYKPDDFENRFTLPIIKPASEYEKLVIPENEPIPIKPVKIEHEPIVHLQPRSPVIEPVDVQPEETPVVIPLVKTEHMTGAKKSAVSLHGAGVELPKLDLVQPGPLPTLSLTKGKKGTKPKKSTVGLCASCFSTKSKEKSKQQETVGEPITATIDQKTTTQEIKTQEIHTAPIVEAPLSLSTTTTGNEPILPKVNIDIFRERSFQTDFKNLPKPDDRLDATIEKIVPVVEAGRSPSSTEQLPSLASTKSTHESPPVVSSKVDTSIFSRVNIDSFRERTFEKNAPVQNLPKLNDQIDAPIDNIVVVTEENHYQLPKNEPITPSETTAKTNESITKDGSIFSQVNIDTFRERILEKGAQNLSKTEAQLNATHEKLTSSVEEPHYELPKNELITPSGTTTKTTESINKDTSIFSQVNIDTFRERTFEKHSKDSFKPVEYSELNIERTILTEEPHYQLPSSEPVPPPQISIENEYSTVERDAYDVPRTTESETKLEQKIINNETMIPSTVDIQKSSGGFLTSKPIVEKVKLEETPTVAINIPIKAGVKQKTSKASTKNKNKSGLISTLFHNKKQKSKIPALDLPPLERDLSSNTQLPPIHQSDHDPLRIPSTNLPKLDIPLPTYSRPEVNMTTGQIKQTSEFAIPVMDLSPIPNLHLPESDKQLIEFNADHMKVPSVQLPDLQFKVNEQKDVSLHETQVKTKLEPIKEITPILSNIEINSLVTSAPEDTLKTQTDKQTVVIATDDSITTEDIIPKLPSNETEIILNSETILIEQTTIKIETNLDKSAELPLFVENKTNPDFNFQLPSTEPVSVVSKTSPNMPPSFDDNNDSQKQKIQKIKTMKKPSTFTLCSCLGKKSNDFKDKNRPIVVPKVNLPEINMPVASSTLKIEDALRIPSTDLPPVDLTPPSIEPITLPAIHMKDKKQATKQIEKIAPLTEIKKQEEVQIQVPVLTLQVEKSTEEDIKVKLDTPAAASESKQVTDIKNVSTKPKSSSSSSFEIKAPALDIPNLDLSGPPKSDVYISWSKKQETVSIPEQSQSLSDSGLEAIVSSHINPSSTFATTATMDDIQQYLSISSGLGSEVLDKTTLKSDTLPDIQELQSSIEKAEETNSAKYDFTRRITLTDEMRTKLKFREDQLKQCLESEISKSIIDFDSKKDHKPLEKILTHAIDIIREKKVTTYPELKQKLIMEHKHDAFIVDPVIRSLYFTFEKQGLDNIDKPEFPLAIRDMVRLPAKHTYDTVTHLNKAEPLTTIQMTNETVSPVSNVTVRNEVPVTIEKKLSEEPTEHAARSCLTCGRSRSKQKSTRSSITSSTGLLDERRRTQLNNHRHELGTILQEHIQSSQPAIRHFNEHSKDVEKIVRKSLVLVAQPKILSYEQLRNDLKTEYKQIFYLVDPTVDVIRDTINHCDITQMNEKINLDILDSNISQTANLYNTQINLLTPEEYNALKSNQLTWLQQYLVNNELKEKKITRKQNKELNKILHRTSEILSTNTITTWDELALQLQREYPKAHDLCNRSIELMKQSKKDCLFLLQQAPNEGKRRPSLLITERAKQNLKANRTKIISSLKSLLVNHNKLSNDNHQLDTYLNKALSYLEEQKQGQFKTYNDLKQQLQEDFKEDNQDPLIEQMVDIIEQAHAINQFDDIEKPGVQTLMKDRLEGKPLIIKEMYVSLPPRIGALKGSNDDGSRHVSTSVNGDRPLNNTTTSHAIARGLSWREANERARILFYRGKHPAIHYDEKADAFDVRMLLETASGGTQEIPVTDSDVHELLNSCGVQWDGVNIISLVDHSEDVVRAAEQAALKVIREKGMIDIRASPSAEHDDIHDDNINGSATPADAATSSS